MPQVPLTITSSKRLKNWMVDSSYWDRVCLRGDDVVICTWPKSGTTWMQQIVGQLIFPNAEQLPVVDLSPWVESREIKESNKLRMLDDFEAQTSRRFMKTHLPADLLPYSPLAKYIFVGRDGRDAVWSWFSHLLNLSPLSYQITANVPGFEGAPKAPPTLTAREFFLDWLENQTHPLGSFWQHINSWWDSRELDNVLLVHYQDLKTDLGSTMQRISNFLEIEVSSSQWPDLVHRCTFEYMKQHATSLSPLLRIAFSGGAQDFIYKGVNGRWLTSLTESDNARYEVAALESLGQECSHWLSHGLL